MRALEIEYKYQILDTQVENLHTLLSTLAVSNTKFIKKDNYYRKILSDKTDKYLDVRIRQETLYDASFQHKLSEQTILTHKIRTSNTPTVDGNVLHDNKTSDTNIATRNITLGEVNEEFETTIQDVQVITTLIDALGFYHHITKHKKGSAYTIALPIKETHKNFSELAYAHAVLFAQLPKDSNITIDFSYVETLGNFLEIEMLIDLNAENLDATHSAKHTTLTHNIQQLLLDFITCLGIRSDQLEPRPYQVMLAPKKSPN